MVTVTPTVRRELVKALAVRYEAATKSDKTRILDEFVALAGFHRKHAIRVLRSGADAPASAIRQVRDKIYDEAVRQALIVLWEAADRICGKRLKALLPLLVTTLERHGHLKLDDVVRKKLLAVGASTIDRLLLPARRESQGQRKRRQAPPTVRAAIPVRTFADWGDPKPGFMEVDLVAHCGGSAAGRFVHTLTLTDIASGWTECVALAVRDAALVVNALRRLKDLMPFPLLGIDSDNGGEFVNDVLLRFCQDEAKIEFTRSRPYKKNDQAWVEQKNGSVVRRMVGYGRLEGIVAAEALARLYDSSRLFVNCFQPSFKLLSKERLGARVRKTYHVPATPCARLLASEHVPAPARERLQAVLASLDPLRLLDEIRTMQRHLAELVAGRTTHVPPHRDADLDRFMASLATAWRGGEVRPTHQRAPKAARTWRTRKDPFAAVWPQLVLWLEHEPDRSPNELFAQLRAEHPGVFPDGQFRTLQRRLREWRSAAARRLVFVGGDRRGDPQTECVVATT